MKKTLCTLISLSLIATACQIDNDSATQVITLPAKTAIIKEEVINPGETETKITPLINIQKKKPWVGSSLPETSEPRAVASEATAPGVLTSGVHAPVMKRNMTLPSMAYQDSSSFRPQEMNTESYIYTEETGFITTINDSLSTFSADVDTASYANIRRFINRGQQIPVGAVRIEEMINYFNYDYPQPDQHSIGINTVVGPCPWEPSHKLVQIGIQAVDIERENLPPSNLVFLIDVSGSMNSPNKLGLLKKSMKMLVAKLGKDDRVAIVVYAGHDRIVLTSTPCANKAEIYSTIDTLSSGGSTNGVGGIQAAYKLARQGFMPQGNNRIILASDGDFNVGTTSHGELEKLIAKKRDSGIFLTVLGFGTGNYHDSTMEVLADKGNGNYAYIDNLLEAKKVLIKEMGGTMHTIAKDVKLQVEFNPALVAGYRLIGYKNRRLSDEDFNNDKKDAGEMGAGHTVTALYEIIPTGHGADVPSVDPLKYQERQRRERQRREYKHRKNHTTNSYDNELLTVKVRYKEANGHTSKVISHVVQKDATHGQNHDFTFITAVAAFGMKLSGSAYADTMSYQNIIDHARKGKGGDENGYRAEFIHLVEKAELMVEPH